MSSSPLSLVTAPSSCMCWFALPGLVSAVFLLCCGVVITQCSVISYRGKTYSLSPPFPRCSAPECFQNRRRILGASVPYRVVLFWKLWLNKREAASVPYELVIATTNKRLYRQSRRRNHGSIDFHMIYYSPTNRL